MTINHQTDRRKVIVPWWEQILRGHRNVSLPNPSGVSQGSGSWGFGAGVKGASSPMKMGGFPVKRLPQPTICVGNITVGGTGKTPLVIRLARDLMAQGLRPRFCAATNRSRPNARLSSCAIRGKSLRRSKSPVMRRWNSPNGFPAPVSASARTKHAVGNYILKRHPVDCFILDDGFQHHRLERDINIVTYC